MTQGFDAQFEQAYAQILVIARQRLSNERAAISTGTLAHELYLSLRGQPGLEFSSREHFLAYSSRAMRSILVDMARERLAKKRHVSLLPLTLSGEVADQFSTPERLIALDDALQRLAALDERLARVAEMRVIGGAEVEDIARVLEVSTATVKRDWQRAKAFIFDALTPL
jgi:RNA polymerase sigma factor (TIGR02999 family)